MLMKPKGCSHIWRSHVFSVEPWLPQPFWPAQICKNNGCKKWKAWLTCIISIRIQLVSNLKKKGFSLTKLACFVSQGKSLNRCSGWPKSSPSTWQRSAISQWHLGQLGYLVHDIHQVSPSEFPDESEQRQSSWLQLRSCESHMEDEGGWKVVSESFLSTTVLNPWQCVSQKRTWSEMGQRPMICGWCLELCGSKLFPILIFPDFLKEFTCARKSGSPPPNLPITLL